MNELYATLSCRLLIYFQGDMFSKSIFVTKIKVRYSFTSINRIKYLISENGYRKLSNYVYQKIKGIDDFVKFCKVLWRKGIGLIMKVRHVLLLLSKCVRV